MTVRLKVLYFASLRDAAGIASESIETSAADLSTLYEEVQVRHRLPLPSQHLRVAMDGAFARWEDVPRDGAEIAFIPPVSGG